MTRIVIAAPDLHRRRRSAVLRLLAPLLPETGRHVVQQVGADRNAYVLGLLPPNRAATSVLNPEDAIVRSRIEGLLINYFESWRPGDRDEYYLDRAYMHMHLATRGSSKQILALHCDPDMNESAEHYKYKRGPHLHIEGADPDVHRAHISLCLHDELLGGSDLGSLSKTMRAAVTMIAKEFFPAWERAARS